MRKCQKSSRHLEREAMRTAEALATGGSPTAARWLAEVEAGLRRPSLASLIACEWQSVAPRLAATIGQMSDEDAAACLHGPIRKVIAQHMGRGADS